MINRIFSTALVVTALAFGATTLSAQCAGGEGKKCCQDKATVTSNNGQHSCCQDKAKGATLSMKTVTFDELKQLMTSNQNIVIVDARGASSFEAGHITGAIHVAAMQLPQDKATPIVFYCGGIKCSASEKEAKKAVALGYTNIMVYRGGWADWSSHGSNGTF